VDCYGAEGAKALWAVISFIDGMPMIYQGDEDPSIYLSEGENLTDFFTGLFAHRKKFIPAGDNETSYIYTGTPVMAFIRGKDNERRLFAINLSGEKCKLDLSPYPNGKSLLNNGGSDIIQPYSYDIFSI
jgi:hypothetical protein